MDFGRVLPSLSSHRCKKCGSSKIEIIGVRAISKGKSFVLYACMWGFLVLIILDHVHYLFPVINKNIFLYSGFGALAALCVFARIIGSAQVRIPRKAAPIAYRCTICDAKFELLPQDATRIELLDEPCTISITARMDYSKQKTQMYVNGVYIGVLNLVCIWEFQTTVRYNVITLQGGDIQPRKTGNRIYTIDATPGGHINLLYEDYQFRQTEL